MKLLKQITAVMAALLIVVNVSFINTSAAMAAPVMAGEELASFLAGALGASGHSQSEIDNLTIPDQLDLLGNDLRNGNISLDTPVTYETNIDGINQSVSVPLDAYMGMSKDIPFYNPPVYALNWYNEAVNSLINDDDVLSDTPNYFTPQSTTDLMGSGAMMKRVDSSTMTFLNTWDYIVIEPLEGDKVKVHFHTDTVTKAYQVKNGVISDPHEQNITYTFMVLDYVGGCFYYEHTKPTSFYGDVRTMDGEPFPTDDEYQYQLGALPDGTVVTPDMLNPDGTVTVDGVTYDPVDYLDPDNLTDEGKHALIDAIADAISNTLVVADDKPIVDEDDITVEVPEELKNFTLSKAIMNVFPFCLPRDFVRGIKTLVQKPEAPVFKAELDLTDFCGYDLGKHTIEISFEKWEPAVDVFRWFSILLFTYSLILLTGKIVKGAGA